MDKYLKVILLVNKMATVSELLKIDDIIKYYFLKLMFCSYKNKYIFQLRHTFVKRCNLKNSFSVLL